VFADSATLKWPAGFSRGGTVFPRVMVDGFLVPATVEPLITLPPLNGSAEFEEREIDGGWVPRRIAAWRHLRNGLKDPLRVALEVGPLGAEIGCDPHPSWRRTVPRGV